MPPPKRQKSPFALMTYSFTVANDVNLYLLSIQYAAHSIVSSIQSVNSKCCWLLVRPVYGRFDRALPPKMPQSPHVLCIMKMQMKVKQFKQIQHIGADSMGAMGAIAPTGKKLWGRLGGIAPRQILLPQVFWNSNMSQLLHRRLIAVVHSQNGQ